MSTFKVIAIGASAGGIEALRQILPRLPVDFPVPICVVIHGPPSAPTILTGRTGKLTAKFAENNEQLRPGVVYLGPPDVQFLIKGNRAVLDPGPRENLWRPAIDPLFRSVAMELGSSAIGVIASGTMDDGVAGLNLIKAEGGTTIVQDPEDAAFRSMPLHAIGTVDVDYVLPADKIADQIMQLLNGDFPAASPPRIIESQEPELSTFICPDCGGPLFQVQDQALTRYRCLVGHKVSVGSLLTEQSTGIERALWTALRVLRERADLLETIAAKLKTRFIQSHSAKRFEDQAKGARQDADAIMSILRTRRETIAADVLEEMSEGSSEELGEEHKG